MKYVYRVRRMVKIVLRETSNPTFAYHEGDNRPPTFFVLAKFIDLDKKYTPRIAATTVAIATGDKYLQYVTSNDSKHSQQRVVVRSEGLKLLTTTGYMNALAGAVGKISPVITIAVSIAALIVSIVALNTKN